MNADEQAIAHLLKEYESALNGSDLDAVMRLYAPDGIFMAQHSPSSVGAEAVRAAYVKVFATIKLTVRFDIAEVRRFTPEWGMARTNSTGQSRDLATGRTSVEGNQELFVLQKLDSWRIARYCFSTTNPPR